MNDKPENPPAFPVPDAGHDEHGAMGMTLRDYFAAKAMQAHVGMEHIQIAISMDKLTPEQICKSSYQWADWMLNARKGGE